MKIKITDTGIEIFNNKYKYFLEKNKVMDGNTIVYKKVYRILDRIVDDDIINNIENTIFLTDLNKEEYYPSFTIKKLYNNNKNFIDDLVLVQI